VNGPTTFSTFDAQGNVCQRLDSTATVTSSETYDAFGKAGGNDADVFGFGGQWGYYHDTDTPLKLHLLGYRYYDSQTGRFLTRDPIGYAGGGNLYRCVGNGPLTGADPLGVVERWQYEAGGVAVGAAGGAVVGGGVPGATILGAYGGMVGGSLYDSADDFGTAFGCFDAGRAKGWQVAWSGAKATYNVVSTAFFLAGITAPARTPTTAPRADVGDLTPQEAVQIQAATDKAGRPIYVGGSAAKGARRGVGTGLPIGKGPGTRSDIDYIIPHSSVDYWKEFVNELPSIDPQHGPIYGVPNPHIGPTVRFEPR
jgi:RHS repeat-associated protein